MKFPITEGQLTSLHSPVLSCPVLSLSCCLVFINMGTKARHQLDWDTYKPFLQCILTFSKLFTNLSKRFSNDGITSFDPTGMWNEMCMKTVKPSASMSHLRQEKTFKASKVLLPMRQSRCQFKIALGNVYLTLFRNSPCRILKRFKHLKMLECDKILCKHSFKYTQTTLNKDLTYLDRKDWISLDFF